MEDVENSDFSQITSYRSSSSSKKTLHIWAIFLFGKCRVLHI